MDAAAVEHLANEERLLGALSATERRTLAELLRRLLLSEPFIALDLSGPWIRASGEPVERAAGGERAPQRSARTARDTRGSASMNISICVWPTVRVW